MLIVYLYELNFFDAIEKLQTRGFKHWRFSTALLEFLTRRNRRSPSLDSCCIVLESTISATTLLSQRISSREFWEISLGRHLHITLLFESGNHLYMVLLHSIFSFCFAYFIWASCSHLRLLSVLPSSLSHFNEANSPFLTHYSNTIELMPINTNNVN